jgi:CubicO group peptidase (beta-lactamase class C family)
VAESLADWSALDAVITAAADEQVPSLTAAVALEGDTAWRGGRGTPYAQYRIGSITKTFTAVLVMRLRDEGLIDLDDPISRYVVDAPYGTSTVRGLLAHSSGMSAEPVGAWWERSEGVSWAALAEANTGRDLVFRPGERYHYSNLGFAMLGELVSRLRGQSWFEAVHDELLVPLGLTETTELPMEGAAPGTSRNPETAELMAEVVRVTRAMAPAGQLWSMVDDLTRWLDFLVTGHPSVLSAETLREMRTVQAGDPDDQHRGGYGLGLRLHWAPWGSIIGHTGSMPGFLAAAFIDPQTRVSAVVLANVTTGLALEDLAAQLVEGGRQQATNDVAADRLAPEADEAALAGPWYWGNTEMALEPSGTGFRLRGRDEAQSFDRVAVDRYRGMNGYFAGETLQVVRRASGEVSHLEVVTFILTRRPYDPNAPIPGGQPGQLA